MTPPAAAPRAASSSVPAYAWVTLAVVYAASVAAPLNQFKVPPLMPMLMPALQIDLTQAGLLMSSIALLGFVLALPAGLLLQRLGSRVTLLIALAGLAAGAALGAFAASFAGLLISRLVEGVGIGLMGVAAPATIAQWFPPDRQGTPMGIWATWVPVGSVIIYNLAPALTAAAGWPAVWWVGAGFALAMMLATAGLIRPAPATAESRAAAAPPDLRQVFANRDIWLLALEFTCMNFALMALATFYPTFLSEVRGYALGEAAFVSSLGTLVVLISAPAAGWLSDRLGSRRLMLALPFLVLAVLFLFPFHATGWQISLIMVVQGLVLGAIPTATFAAAPEIMRKPEWAGLGLAGVLLGQNLGQLLGPLVFGQLVGPLGWAGAGYVLIPVCLVGFISGWRLNIR